MTEMTIPNQRAKKKVRRILLVDDHPIVRDGLVSMINLTEDLEVCGEANSAREAMRLFNQLKPDLVIVDINLEGVSGLELIKQIRAYDENARMLVLSMHEESLYAERALRAGAMGYLRKKQISTEVIDAIRQVLSGYIHVSDEISDRMLQRVTRRGDGGDRPPMESLSDRELEVFQLIGNGLTTREIAEMLSLSKKTIESYREQLKSKLHLNSGSELLRMAIRWQAEHE